MTGVTGAELMGLLDACGEGPAGRDDRSGRKDDLARFATERVSTADLKVEVYASQRTLSRISDRMCALAAGRSGRCECWRCSKAERMDELRLASRARRNGR